MKHAIAIPVVLTALAVPPYVAGQDTTRYFYRGLPYGSDAYMGPFDLLLNGSYALSIADSGDRKIFEKVYGFDSVADALAHPFAAIERAGGWWRFIRTEMLPLSYRANDVKWYTNYTGHLAEGGIRYRRLAEWYQAHRVPLPHVLAGVTTLTAAFMNEAYENRNSVGGTAATVADLYFFDIGGVVLFSLPGVPRFFVEKLHAGIWTGQASLVFPAAEIANNSNHMFFKIPWRVVPGSSVFVWTGVGAQGGLTLHRPDGLDISLALGGDAERMQVDPVTGEETAKLTASGGVFVDRNNSLLASLYVSQIQHRLLRVNVYPGVLGGVGRHFGLWAIMSRDFKFQVGISHRALLGAGLGLGK